MFLFIVSAALSFVSLLSAVNPYCTAQRFHSLCLGLSSEAPREGVTAEGTLFLHCLKKFLKKKSGTLFLHCLTLSPLLPSYTRAQLSNLTRLRPFRTQMQVRALHPRTLLQAPQLERQEILLPESHTDILLPDLAESYTDGHATVMILTIGPLVIVRAETHLMAGLVPANHLADGVRALCAATDQLMKGMVVISASRLAAI